MAVNKKPDVDSKPKFVPSVDSRNRDEVSKPTPIAKESVDSRNEAEKRTLDAATKPLQGSQEAPEPRADEREFPESARLQTAPPEVFQQPTDGQNQSSDSRSEAEKNTPQVQPTDAQAKPLNRMSTKEKDEVSARTGLQPAQAVEVDKNDAQAFERNGALQNDSKLSNKGSRKA